jgi:hypothetical protein
MECRRVNAFLLEEARKLDLGTTKSLARMDEARQLRGNRERFSRWARLEFREYIRRKLELHPDVRSSDMINGGALLLGVSPVTTRRYLADLRTGGTGPFIVQAGKVTINPFYVSPEMDDHRQARPHNQEPGEE